MPYRVVYVGSPDDPLTDPVVIADTDLVLPLNVATVRVLPRRVPWYSAYVYPWPAGRSVVTEIRVNGWTPPADYIRPPPPDLGRPRFIPFDEGSGSGRFWFVKERHLLDNATAAPRHEPGYDRLFVSLWDSTYAAAIASGGVSNVPFLASLRANHIELPPLVTAPSAVGLSRSELDALRFTFREVDGSLPRPATMLRRGAGFWGTGSYEPHVAPLGVTIDQVGSIDRASGGQGVLCLLESRRVLASENVHPAVPGEKIWRMGWAKRV